MKSKQVSAAEAVALVHGGGFAVLGPAIHARGLSAHIDETREEAEAAL